MENYEPKCGGKKNANLCDCRELLARSEFEIRGLESKSKHQDILFAYFSKNSFHFPLIPY